MVDAKRCNKLVSDVCDCLASRGSSAEDCNTALYELNAFLFENYPDLLQACFIEYDEGSGGQGLVLFCCSELNGNLPLEYLPLQMIFNCHIVACVHSGGHLDVIKNRVGDPGAYSNRADIIRNLYHSYGIKAAFKLKIG